MLLAASLETGSSGESTDFDPLDGSSQDTSAGASSAHETDDERSTDTGGTADTTDTTNATGNLDGSDSEPEDPSNGSDCRSGVLPVITSPIEGAHVSAPFTVTATLGYACYCDTGGCYEIPGERAWLRFGGKVARVPCDFGTCTVDLAPGPYTITIEAYDADGFGHVRHSDPISIVVEDDSASSSSDGSTGTPASDGSTGTPTSDGSTGTPASDGSTGTPTSDGSSDGSTGDPPDPPGANEASSGCACSTGASAPNLGWGVLLVMPFAFRRRRARLRS